MAATHTVAEDTNYRVQQLEAVILDNKVVKVENGSIRRETISFGVNWNDVMDLYRGKYIPANGDGIEQNIVMKHLRFVKWNDKTKGVSPRRACHWQRH